MSYDGIEKASKIYALKDCKTKLASDIVLDNAHSNPENKKESNFFVTSGRSISGTQDVLSEQYKN